MGVQGGGTDMSTMQKGPLYRSVSVNTFVSHCSKLTGCSSLICLSYI